MKKLPNIKVNKIFRKHFIILLLRNAIIAILIVPEDVNNKIVNGNATDREDNTGIFAQGQIKPKYSGITQIEL